MGDSRHSAARRARSSPGAARKLGRIAADCRNFSTVWRFSDRSGQAVPFNPAHSVQVPGMSWRIRLPEAWLLEVKPSPQFIRISPGTDQAFISPIHHDKFQCQGSIPSHWNAKFLLTLFWPIIDVTTSYVVWECLGQPRSSVAI